jgi:hypothetical protein
LFLVLLSGGGVSLFCAEIGSACSAGVTPEPYIDAKTWVNSAPKKKINEE